MATVTDGQPRSSGRTFAGTGDKPAPAPGAADRPHALLAPRAGAPQADAVRADAARVDAPQAGAPQADAVRAGTPHMDAPYAGAPRTDAPRTDASHAGVPRAGAPRDAPADGHGAGTGGGPGTWRPSRSQEAPDRAVPDPAPVEEHAARPQAAPDAVPAEEHAAAAPFRAKPMSPARPHPPGDSPLRFTVPAHASRAALVRRRVTEHLSRLGLPEELCDSVVLGTDELFANAVTHTGIRAHDTVTLTVELIRGAVRVMVADPSPVPPLLRTVDGGAESGRGLAIVSVLADAWGVAPAEPGKPGKRVWFTLAHPGPSQVAP